MLPHVCFPVGAIRMVCHLVTNLQPTLPRLELTLVTTASNRAWVLVVLRAVAAAAVALLITFSADHSTRLGFTALGSLALVTGVILALGARAGAFARLPSLLQGALLVVGGIAAVVLSGATVQALIVLSSALIGVTGIIELVAGVRARGSLPAARDWIFIGALSAVFAVAVLFVPADFVQAITIPDKDVPPLTASVVVVGLLGAYAAIVAVYLVIAGLSLKWAPQASTPVGSEAP